MIKPIFEYNAEANGYLSDPFDIEDLAEVHIELVSRAPVVTLKREDDGEYSNYGQTPRSATHFKIEISSVKKTTVRLATPVQVVKCYVLKPNAEVI